MVETWVMYGSAATLLVVGSMVGGLVARLLWSYLLERDLASLEARIKRLEMASISGSGVAVREAKASRQAEALAKLAVAMKAGKKPQDAINEVAAEYPDVALDVAGKFMREGNIGSLGSLLR